MMPLGINYTTTHLLRNRSASRGVFVFTFAVTGVNTNELFLQLRGAPGGAGGGGG